MHCSTLTSPHSPHTPKHTQTHSYTPKHPPMYQDARIKPTMMEMKRKRSLLIVLFMLRSLIIIMHSIHARNSEPFCVCNRTSTGSYLICPLCLKTYSITSTFSFGLCITCHSFVLTPFSCKHQQWSFCSVCSVLILSQCEYPQWRRTDVSGMSHRCRIHVTVCQFDKLPFLIYLSLTKALTSTWRLTR